MSAVETVKALSKPEETIVHHVHSQVVVSKWGSIPVIIFSGPITGQIFYKIPKPSISIPPSQRSLHPSTMQPVVDYELCCCTGIHKSEQIETAQYSTEVEAAFLVSTLDQDGLDFRSSGFSGSQKFVDSARTQ